MKIANNIIDLIGNTPIVRLEKYAETMNVNPNIYAKLEYFNPCGSVKDRVAYNMIKCAEEKGILKKDSVIIEPTSGNTGIGLAGICAYKGYRLILTMPESMSVERRKLLKAYGAEIVLTKKEEGMSGAINKANELSKEYKNSFIPSQFSNIDNPLIHYQTTGAEIWNDMNGNIDIFVAGVGTGGTVSGIGKYLKEKNPNIKIIAVEPFESAVISGEKSGPHKIQGIGAGFIPKNYDKNIVDEVIKIKGDQAIVNTTILTKTEGFLCGISSGAALLAAKQLAEKYPKKNIVALFPDTGERYLSVFE